jgi:hypothetical protein
MKKIMLELLICLQEAINQITGVTAQDPLYWGRKNE